MELPGEAIVPYVVIALVTLLAAAGLRSYDAQKTDAREPPIVPAAIPFVGHLLGILTQGSRYFKSIGSRYRYPIFTLPTLNSRTYIVAEPSLAASVQRASKALSFNPVIPQVTKRVLGFDEPTIELMKSDMEHGFVQEIQELVHSRLSPGHSLDEVTLAAGLEFVKCLDTYRSAASRGPAEDLLKWVKHTVTIATANFLYGPQNPVKDDPRLVEQFWDFDDGIPGLLVGLAPSITAKKAYRGRESLVEVFRQFLGSDAFKLAASITQDRDRIAEAHGVTPQNIARSDLSFLFAGIVNTSLASFWMILNIFSRPELLAEIRAEIEATLETSSERAGSRTMSMKRVVTTCPLLTSSFRETLRLYSDNFSTRVVTEDTLLADRYFLRKGAIIQVSGGIIHSDERIWGEDVGIFNPRRFMPAQTALRQKPIHPAAFRAFGGGSTLCPGRHFALNEIVGYVAMVVLLFDISQEDSAGRRPQKKDNVVPIHVLEPLTAVSAKISARSGWEDVVLELQK